MDALNWDLLNDGIGNPKNTKSLLQAHETPPAMAMGCADTAKRRSAPASSTSSSPCSRRRSPRPWTRILKSLKPVPSPLLVNGRLSDSARRGEKLFKDRQVGCASCHPPACSPT